VTTIAVTGFAAESFAALQLRLSTAFQEIKMTPKNKPRPILVPVDFSTCSEAALLYALELAEQLKVPLTVLHVVHDLGDAPGYYSVKGRKKQLRRMEDVAADMLSEFIQKMLEKCGGNTRLEKAETMLVVGLPVSRIMETAKRIDARMIIMGSQGRTGLAHVLLGSKAEQLVRLSPLPVMIVKEGCNKKSTSESK
jgi:nucleotide-binding universal stress UspA family protein